MGSVANRVQYGIFDYPHYAYGVYWAAVLASRLGIPRISVIELGVAGGRGLLALESASAQIERAVGVEIGVIGFDSGEGMPAPVDYRDLPHVWGRGFFKMDAAKLRSRLGRAELVLGDVATTTRSWLATQPAPIGFIAFDLDYYSSTKAAFGLLEGRESSHLPRVYCFFDDLVTAPLGCMNEYVGELLAIREFNQAHDDRKLCKIEGVRVHRPRWEDWQDRMYAFHDFAHEKYATNVTSPDQKQLPL